MDLAHLGIKIDYADIDKAVNKLKELEKVSSAVEKQTKGISFTPKSNTELNKLTAEIKALNKQAQILGETSSVSAKEVDRLAAKLKYLEKQASLKGLSQGNRELQNIIRQTGQSIDNLTGKIKTSDNIVKRWWKRFGEVGVGFTLIYQTVNLVTGAIHSLNQVILDGIKLSGELVSAQAKLSMWLEMGSQGAISFQEAMNVSKQTIQALADASLTSTSTLKELATGLDEVSQAGVFISKDVMPKFADLIDFTKMVAETTGSTTRQIRQELQALMQGQVKTTNLLIRTAQQLHILTDEDIQGLKEMQNRQEVIEKLSESISSYWEKVKEVIISADVNTAFDKWYDSLTRLVTKATELTSETQGTMNIFGATIYKHIQELNKELQNMNVEKYENFFLGLNIALDKFLTLAEKAVKSLMSIDISTDSVNLKFKELENFLKGVLTPFQLFYKIAKDLDDKLVDLTGALEDMGIHLVSIHKIVGEAFVYRLIFGNWKAGFVLATLTEIDNLISDIIGEGEKSHSIINSLKGAAEYGIIGTYLFGWEAGLTIGALKLVVDYLAEIRKAGDEGRRKSEGAVNPYIQEHLDKYLSEKYPTTPGELEKWRKKMDEEFDKAVKKYKKAIEEINNALKKLKEDTELEEYAQKVKESLITPIEKLIQEKTKLDKLVEAGKISHEQELEYLAKEAKGYYNLKSPIEKVMEILSGAPNTWDKNLQALKNNEQAVDDFIKHLQDLEKYAQRLETSAQTPLQKFISGFEKLQETEALVGLSDKAYAEGLLELSKNIIDTKDKEDLLRQAFALYADELKNLPADEVIRKIKEIASSFDTHKSLWDKGIDKYLDSIKDLSESITDIIAGMFDNLEDMLVDFITTGEASFEQLVSTIQSQIARMFVQQLVGYVTAPLAQSMYGMFGSPAGTTAPTSPVGGTLSFPTSNFGFLNYTLPGTAAVAGADAVYNSLSLTSDVLPSLESSMPAWGESVSLMPGMGTAGTSTAYSNLSLTNAATGTAATTGGVTLGQALGVGSLGGLGYSTIGSAVGLPQNQYTGITSTLGGTLGYWGGSAAGAALGGALGSVVPIVGTAIGATAGGLLGGAFSSTPDDADLHIYFGDPYAIPEMPDYPVDEYVYYTPDMQWVGGEFQPEYYQWDRAVGNTVAVNIRKGDSMSDAQAQEIENAIAGYFDSLFNNIENIFGISVEEAIGNQAIGFHENDYSGDINATIQKYTDTFFQYFTDELADSILGTENFIDYDTLKQFQLAGESISDTFIRVMSNLQTIPDAVDRINTAMEESGEDLVTAYNDLVDKWNFIQQLMMNTFANIDFTLDWNAFSSQVVGNFQWQFVNGLYQVFIQGLNEQISTALLDNFNTDLESLWDGFWEGSVSIDSLTSALDIVNNVLDENQDKWNEMIDIFNELGITLDSARNDYINALQTEIDSLNEIYNNYENAKATYESALQDEISSLEQQQQALETAYEQAKNDYLNALQDEISTQSQVIQETQALIDTFDNLTDSIRQARTELLTQLPNSELSYNYLQSQLNTLMADITSGDTERIREAMKQLPTTASSYLGVSKQYSSYEQYQADYYSVISMLNQAEAIGESQQSIQEQQIEILTQSNNELQSIYDEISGKSGLTLAEAEQNYYDAQLALSQSTYEDQIEYYQSILDSLNEQISLAEAEQNYYDAKLALDEANYDEQIQYYQSILDVLMDISNNTLGLSEAQQNYINALNDAIEGGASQYTEELSQVSTVAGIPTHTTPEYTPEELDKIYQEEFAGITPVSQSFEDKFNAWWDKYGDSIDIPHFASGGTVTQPTLAVVGEAGIEHITPDSQMKDVKEKLGEIKEILWMMLNTTGDNKKTITKLYNLVTGWDYEGLPATRE